MAPNFDRKVAFVTGAAGGIGFRIAEMLAEGGARVTVADLDGGAARTAAERIGRGASGVAAGTGCAGGGRSVVSLRSAARRGGGFTTVISWTAFIGAPP